MADIIQILVNGSKIFLIMIVMIVLIILFIMNKREKLKPDCQKNFLKGFMIYLGLSLLNLIFIQCIMEFIIPNAEENEINIHIYLFIYFSIISSLNLVRAIILYYYIEKNLFYKKTKLKSFIVAVVLNSLAYILHIISLFLCYLTSKGEFNSESYLKYYFVSRIISNSITIIIGILLIILFILTPKEKPEIRKYSIWLSIGTTLTFIVTPTIICGITIVEELTPTNSSYSILRDILVLSWYFIKGIGYIILAIGAYNTIKVPLSFAKLREKKQD